MNRITRHFLIVAVACLVAAIVFVALDSPDRLFRVSMGTAYSGLLLLAATLAIGPINLMRGKAAPVSTYLRRDIGIWAGIVSIVHMVVGLQVHMGGDFRQYFFHDPDQMQGYAVRMDVFGLANHTGLVATILCLLLLALSNNGSLRNLGPSKWKKFQRLNYLLFLLVIVHGLIYQLIEKRETGYILFVVLVSATILALQWRGARLHAGR